MMRLNSARARFSGLGGGSQQMPENRSGKRKKEENWLGRLSGHSSSSDGEFETVIAASAFAITSLEEENSLDQKSPSLIKMVSRKEDKLAGKASSKRFTENVPPATQKMPEKVTGARRTPSFSGTHPNDKEIVKPSVSFKEKPRRTSSIRDQIGTSKEERGTEAKADTWEKAQMDKIEKRYEKQRSTIMSWENEKQTKARRQLEKEERKLELKRVRVGKEYRNEMERIKKIAGGAMALAEERRRNDEAKTKEKAKIFRKTGKMPVTCFCF